MREDKFFLIRAEQIHSIRAPRCSRKKCNNFLPL